MRLLGKNTVDSVNVNFGMVGEVRMIYFRALFSTSAQAPDSVGSRGKNRLKGNG